MFFKEKTNLERVQPPPHLLRKSENKGIKNSICEYFIHFFSDLAKGQKMTVNFFSFLIEFLAVLTNFQIIKV
jgi:hypothetical protein